MKNPTKNLDLGIIDGNNFAHRALHAYDRLSHRGQSTSIIYGMPSMVKSIIWRDKPDKLIIVWDGDKSKHRKKICPEYKSHRLKKAKGLFDYESFQFQRRTVMDMFYHLGIPQVWNRTQEADDMIYRIAKVSIKTWKTTTIYSGDKDFHQLLRPSRKLVIWNDHKQDEIHWGNCRDNFGYSPDQCVDYLVLVGDDSDDIKGYPGIGPKKALALLEKHGSLVEFLESDQEHPGIDKERLEKIYNRNRQLIDLAYYYRLHREDLTLKFFRKAHPSFNSKAFKEVANRFNLERIISNPRFLQEFLDLKMKDQ